MNMQATTTSGFAAWLGHLFTERFAKPSLAVATDQEITATLNSLVQLHMHARISKALELNHRWIKGIDE